MESVSVGFISLISDKKFAKLACDTMDDRLLYSEGLEILSKSQFFYLYEGDLCIGFFSQEDRGDSVEAHAYILPEHRRHSLAALRYIIFKQDKDITTSVYGTHPHVLKFLKRVGFQVTDTLVDALVKNGKTYPVWVLKLSKEN